ncbi:MAG: penicillin-binding protein 2, penicillin-binding protein 1C [Candidatus Peregrinibacteria bacterium GW2011_GWF2_33_10]|nr:MAG: penicillin-binding protein 2, penicillin-binding protein 1C [Candidatus Peregrinibacteria bacterium GW2011_GWF2_33_10]
MKKILTIIALILSFIIAGFFTWANFASKNLLELYKQNESTIVTDRNNKIIEILPNQKKFYAIYTQKIPGNLKNLLIQKEDQYFYYHLGLNPISKLRAIWRLFFNSKNTASSTITEQLTKILLNHENDRTGKNKIIEIFYTKALEINLSKNKILEMYLNSIFFGHNVQGISLASRLYFDKNSENLSNEEICKLLATISSPTNLNPFIKNNKKEAEKIAGILGLENLEINDFEKKEIQILENKFNNFITKKSAFEIKDLKLNKNLTKKNLTIDQDLNDKIRSIAKEKLSTLYEYNARNAAIVVIKIPENELIAIVGTKDPYSDLNADQVNMAMKSRAIGSTVKPFIYTKGFEKDLRPYTLVDDREYKYYTAGNFAHYPKNYDYQYHGIITLHIALSNSLNVPTLKVLEYVGLKNFYNFLSKDLQFKSVQPLETYEYGIALGNLEMDLLSLSYYFTIFPNNGYLKPLKTSNNGDLYFTPNKKIFDEKYIELTNKILSDRNTGIDQFGMASNLNLPQKNFAVKTGTSQKFRDTWTIGYTPDFLVGVWVGNADNSPMKELSSQIGAGLIWHDVMTLLLNSNYNKKTPFVFDQIQNFPNENTIEYGLKNDDFEYHKNLLINPTLILSPHNNDEFLFSENLQIPLKSNEELEWYINGKFLAKGTEVIWQPKIPGTYQISATNENKGKKGNYGGDRGLN